MSALSDFLDAATGTIAFVFEALFRVFFNISPLYTDGVWPLGQPVAPEGATSGILLNGGMVAYSGMQAYDKVAPSQAGGILIISLMIFFFAYVVGGYLQFFDWKTENPKRKRDPVNGLFLILLWFPIYYGFVGTIHALVLSIPISLADITFFITTVVANAVLLPTIGQLGFIVGGIGLLVIAFIMLMRPIVIGVYLLFGQPLIAVAWADIPRASDVALQLLIKSVPVALVPLPLYFMMGGLSVAITGTEVLGYTIGGWGVTALVLTGSGIFFFAGGVWITVWLMWLVFTRTGQYVEQAGQSVGKLGGTLGFVAAGRPEDAQRAARYGPESVIGREAMKRTSNWRGESGERSDADSGTESGGFVDRVKFWGGDDGSRD